jgi:RND family efflux transporter MFP subunit
MGINRYVISSGLCVAAILTSACREKAGATVQANEAPPVIAAAMAVQPRPFNAVVSVTGSLVSRTHVEVRAETFGRVLKFTKEEGDAVRAGEPILWVEEDNYRLALKQAESAVQVAEAGLARSKVLAVHAQQELDRAQHLILSGGITDKDLKLAVVTEQDGRSQVKVSEAQLDQARTAVDLAKKKLADTVVRAPVDGEIQKKFVNTGSYVEAPTPVVVIVNNQRIELEALIPASELGQVRGGMRVTFKVNSFPDKTFEGRIIELAPAVDAESRSAKVRIQVPNSNGLLKAGMFVEGEILTGVTKSAIVVPAAALHRDESRAAEGMVYLIDNGRAIRRKVMVGREYDGSVEIAAGLKTGEMLITEQSLEVAEGVRVQARENGHVSQ